MTLRALAEQIAYDLHENGSGTHAGHLRQYTDKTKDAVYLGGWSERVVADKVEDRLREYFEDDLEPKRLRA
jgi:hypothetical protein